MAKQLIMITAPFNCGYCVTAKEKLPSLCEKYGFELIEMQNENDDKEDLPVDLYPTILFRVNEEIKETLNGYEEEKIIKEFKKY